MHPVNFLLKKITQPKEGSTIMRALITGITGQDGAYLAKFLLEQGYEVFGLARGVSNQNPRQLRALKLPRPITVLQGDLLDFASLVRALQVAKPDEIYNLAAQSFVGVSWNEPILTAATNALGVLNLLEALRLVKPSAKFYQASTSEMFGLSPAPQNEQTPFRPCSPYAVSKLFGHWITVNYRESYDIVACCGILFNHESPQRGNEFVTQKSAQHAARFSLGLTKEPLRIGYLDGKRDWGFAGDYVVAMHLMLQQLKPDDYVIGTGQLHTVRDFIALAFATVGKRIDWRGTGLNEKGFDSRTGQILVVVDQQFYRPVETRPLQADFTKAKKVLGWQPTVSFEQLVEMMVKAAIERLR